MENTEKMRQPSKNRTLSYALLCVVFTLNAFADYSSVPSKEGNLFIFKASTESPTLAPIAVQPSFLDAEWMGTLQPSKSKDKRLPFVLFKGKTCDNCENDQKSYYLFNLKQNSKIYSFIQPGKIIDLKKKGLISESRSFFGECLHPGSSGFFSFRKEHVNKKRGFQKSVYIAVIPEGNEPSFSSRDDHARETELIETVKEGKRGLPRIETALHFVKLKKCFELPKVNRFSLSKAFDLGPNRAGQKEEDEEETELEKEKEKDAVDSTDPKKSTPEETTVKTTP